MHLNLEPKLAEPGAGLPLMEMWIGRLLFTVRRWTGNRDLFNAAFQNEREAIRALVRRCDAESGSQRVLIRRLRGLEDSSRYWSVWMTLDHLRIVNRSMTRTIGALSKGVTPEGAASTARVKPSPEASVAVVTEYEQSCDDLLALVASLKDLDTRARYAHPWFGSLNVAGWHALAARHIGIHRWQIERIVAGIGKEESQVDNQPATSQ